MSTLAFLIALSLSAPPLITVPPPVNGIPQAPLLVDGLPEDVQEDGGTWLPRPLDLAVADYIAYCVEMPRLCEKAVHNEKTKIEAAETGWLVPAVIGAVVGIVVTVAAVAGIFYAAKDRDDA